MAEKEKELLNSELDHTAHLHETLVLNYDLKRRATWGTSHPSQEVSMLLEFESFEPRVLPFSLHAIPPAAIFTLSLFIS